MKTPISPKVTAAALAAAFATLVMWGIDASVAGDIPGGVEAAITTIFTFGISWLVPDRLREEGQAARLTSPQHPSPDEKGN